MLSKRTLLTLIVALFCLSSSLVSAAADSTSEYLGELQSPGFTCSIVTNWIDGRLHSYRIGEYAKDKRSVIDIINDNEAGLFKVNAFQSGNSSFLVSFYMRTSTIAFQSENQKSKAGHPVLTLWESHLPHARTLRLLVIQLDPANNRFRFSIVRRVPISDMERGSAMKHIPNTSKQRGWTAWSPAS